MNREILFRGKRTDNGEWVEGIPINTHIGVFMCFDENPHYCSQYGYMEIDEIAKIIPETLCQYTGLTDKNSQKIWENDIICHDISGTIGTVKWYKEDYVGWCVNDIIIAEQQFTDEMWDECEVIGNIFDNPELLEGGD